MTQSLSHSINLSTTSTSKCPFMHHSVEGMKADLTKLNALFLSTYSTQKQTTKESLGKTIPVIFIKGDDLIVRHKGESKTVRYVPEQYHLLKSIAHISCLADNVFWKKHHQQDTKELEEICLNTLDQLEEFFTSNDYEPLAKHGSIIKKFKDLLSTEDRLEQAAKMQALEPDLKALINEAAISRLDALDTEVRRIKEELGPEAWEKVIVINMSPQMPRDGELASQYFSAVLNKKDNQCPYNANLMEKTNSVFQNQRLIYAESIYDEDKALDLAVTHICDEKLGKHVFGNKEVMHADVLKCAAGQHLLEMKLPFS